MLVQQKMNPVTFVKSMPKDNRYDKDGKPYALLKEAFPYAPFCVYDGEYFAGKGV